MVKSFNCFNFSFDYCSVSRSFWQWFLTFRFDNFGLISIFFRISMSKFHWNCNVQFLKCQKHIFSISWKISILSKSTLWNLEIVERFMISGFFNFVTPNVNSSLLYFASNYNFLKFSFGTYLTSSLILKKSFHHWN